jgi:hypothetical protein
MKQKINPYKPLLIDLYVPSGFMKLMLVMVSIIFIAVWVLIWIDKGQATATDAVIPMLYTILLSYFFIVAMLLPHQAMTMISSKSMRYLTDFRKFYLVSAFLFTLVWVILIVISIVYKQPQIGLAELSRNGLNIGLIASVYMMSLFFMTYRMPAFQGVIFVTFGAIPYMLNTLSVLNVYFLVGLLLIVWMFFAYWFLRLRPQKSHVNIFSQNMQQVMLSGTTANPSANWITNFLTPSSVPSSFLGTRLMGMSDSWAAIIRMWFFVGLVTLVLLLFFKWVMKDDFNHFLGNTGAFFVLIIVTSCSSGIVIGICRNIKSTWIFYSGKREQMFLTIELISMQYSVKIALVIPVLLLMINLIAGFAFVKIPDFFWLFVMTIIVNWLSLYASLYIYSRDDESKLPDSSLYATVVLVSTILLVVLGALLIFNQYTIIGATLMFILLLGLFLRTHLLKKWQTINFVRVG